MSLPFPSKVVCVGKNYAAHAAELGGDVPSESAERFMTGSLCLPADPVKPF